MRSVGFHLDMAQPVNGEEERRSPGYKCASEEGMEGICEEI
jgi:hypothetical protein